MEVNKGFEAQTEARLLQRAFAEKAAVKLTPPPARDWYFIAEQPAPAPHLAHPEGCAALLIDIYSAVKQVDVKLSAKWNSNSDGARPVHLIITMIEWFRTSGLSRKKSLS